eukprot:3935372-Amphidinium_carterae.1
MNYKRARVSPTVTYTFDPDNDAKTTTDEGELQDSDYRAKHHMLTMSNNFYRKRSGEATFSTTLRRAITKLRRIGSELSTTASNSTTGTTS